jgi:hypothetical protein
VWARRAKRGRADVAQTRQWRGEVASLRGARWGVQFRKGESGALAVRFGSVEKNRGKGKAGFGRHGMRRTSGHGSRQWGLAGDSDPDAPEPGDSGGSYVTQG